MGVCFSLKKRMRFGAIHLDLTFTDKTELLHGKTEKVNRRLLIAGKHNRDFLIL